MNTLLHKFGTSCFIVILTVQLAGCGTLIYPERRGQKGGRLDIGIVALDAIGLFFFLIPGVIAFAVDFSNGSIYLPGTATANVREIKFDPKQTDLSGIERIVRQETGRPVQLHGNNVRVSRLANKQEMAARFVQIQQIDPSNRLAYAR
ncbi:MAG: hypothetical protein JNN05_10305 [Candidatus Omnitrophica bacterium]|nr:hypothetical protein [Candidatus Omnitrophota bacterium]